MERTGTGIQASPVLGASALELVRRSVRDAMRDLPAGEAQALWLRVGLDLPYDEVATRLGCSVGAARVRVFRGLARLTDSLEVT